MLLMKCDANDQFTESTLKVLITQAEIEPFKDELKKCTDRVRAAGDDVFDKEGIYKAVTSRRMPYI